MKPLTKNYQDPRLCKTIRLTVIVSNTPWNRKRMSSLVERSEATFKDAQGFAVIKYANEDLKFMANPNKTTPPTN